MCSFTEKYSVRQNKRIFIFLDENIKNCLIFTGSLIFEVENKFTYK